MMTKTIDSKLAELLMEVSAIMGRTHDTEHNGPFEPHLFVWSNFGEDDSWVEVAYDADVGTVVKVGVGVKDEHRVMAVFGMAELMRRRENIEGISKTVARMEII